MVVENWGDTFHEINLIRVVMRCLDACNDRFGIFMIIWFLTIFFILQLFFVTDVSIIFYIS